MKTPIFDFVKKYSDENCIRLHMPGHKGISKLGPEALDITEVSGADVLYQSNGIIKESQDNASKIFGTAKTLYSTEGSSLCIRAMLFLIKQYAISKNKKPSILAGRNAHKTFVTASALVDIDVSWLYSSQDDFLSCDIDLANLQRMLKKIEPTALYITSPDYLGNISDIQSISKLCKKYDVLLLVDNAHGSYLKFLESSLHPIDLGADMCCDSAHKTLPVLTGGAYFHISKNAPLLLKDNAENAMSIFASTSPSYLILQSLDLFNKSVVDGFKNEISDVADCV
ncbi:MAG: aminotransferase class V-fold PLP-dependent enzyme, partial [Clostridia bacterium]|nr:aminotransferase class V-fold PLP-dependent enzyme [Clostridia bacterium]